MKSAVLLLLVNLLTHQPLQFHSDDRSPRELVDSTSGERSPIRDGIPAFLSNADISGLNRKYQLLYDSVAPYYDIVQGIYYRLKRGGQEKTRRGYL